MLLFVNIQQEAFVTALISTQLGSDIYIYIGIYETFFVPLKVSTETQDYLSHSVNEILAEYELR